VSSLRVVPPSPEQLALSDAREFGRIVGRNWEGALLVARSAERAEQGRRSDLAQNAPGRKLSLRRFADEAGCSRKTAAGYLDAWNRAAADGLVPPVASLAPGTQVDLSRLDAKAWERYYSADSKRSAAVDWAAEVIQVVEGRRGHGFRFSSPEPHRQLARFVRAMGKLPPHHPQGWWDDALEDTWAWTLVRALHRVRPETLSTPLALAEKLRKEADRIEAAAAQAGDEQ